MSESVLIALIATVLPAISSILVALISYFYRLEIEKTKQKKVTGLQNPPISNTGRSKIILSTLIGVSIGLLLGLYIASIFIKQIGLINPSVSTNNTPVIIIVTATPPTQSLILVTDTPYLQPTNVALPTSTFIPPTTVPAPVPATVVLPTIAPPTIAPPTVVPPTAAPPIVVPPTAAPPIVVPPTAAPPIVVPPTAAPPISCDATPHTTLPQSDHFFPGAIHIAELWRSNKQTPWGDSLVRAIVHGDISVIAAGGSIWTYPAGCESIVQVDVTNNPKATVISEEQMRGAGLIK